MCSLSSLRVLHSETVQLIITFTIAFYLCRYVFLSTFAKWRYVDLITQKNVNKQTRIADCAKAWVPYCANSDDVAEPGRKQYTRFHDVLHTRKPKPWQRQYWVMLKEPLFYMESRCVWFTRLTFYRLINPLLNERSVVLNSYLYS
jgi:hypothetical protein